MRPQLNIKLSIEDFKNFYWLKSELQGFCKSINIKSSGSKIELAERIEYYLKTGNEQIVVSSSLKPESKFNWHSADLTPCTIITDNYKNTQNVRRFFQTHLSKSFKFNVVFMNWMKANHGKNLQDAIDQYLIISKKIKSNTEPKVIAPQFEYNTYIRDFLLDNPEKSRKIGIELWKIKKSLRGTNAYERSDLKLVNQ